MTSSPGRIFLTTSLPGRTERRIALALMLILGVAFVWGMPIASRPAGKVPAFLPAYESALFLCDLMTASLLLGQYLRSRLLSVLILGGAYLFDSLLIIAHALSFPDLFAPGGMLGAGEQTTVWLYIFWHAGFPVFVLGYVVVRAREELTGPFPLRRRAATSMVFGGTVGLAVAAGLLAFPGQHLLPEVIHGNDHSRLISTGIAPVAWTLSILAFILLWFHRRRSVLDNWLLVVMWAWILDVGLAIVIGTRRFDWGFYLSRSYGLLSATIVLATLLLEVNRLYTNLMQTLALAEARNMELQRSRDELARVQRLEAVGQLTGGVAHDFNNLLTVIAGNLEMLLASATMPDRQARFARAAQQAARRGALITEQLLTFARRQISHPVLANINALLTNFEPLMRQALTPGTTLQLALSAEPLFVRLDIAQFEAALLNLLANARDAMPEGGALVVQTALPLPNRPAGSLGEKAYALVTVSDTGVGMTPEVQARAFEPFFTTKPVGGGSGLGLSQVYGFVTGALGRIEIDSESGSGCTIRMHLPLASRAAVPLPARQATSG